MVPKVLYNLLYLQFENGEPNPFGNFHTKPFITIASLSPDGIRLEMEVNMHTCSSCGTDPEAFFAEEANWFALLFFFHFFFPFF